MISPTGLSEHMTRPQKVIDGERYVSLRHVHSLFEHTEEGMSFYRVRRRWLGWRRGEGLIIGDIVGEDRPQLLLDREFGSLFPEGS